MNPFENVGGLYPRSSVFDLSHEKKFTGDMGILYPVMLMKAIPGDRLKLGIEIVARNQPYISPIMHEINIYTYTFFTPFRILATKPGFNFEKYYTKGKDGKALDSVPKYVTASYDTTIGSLCDHFGFPLVTNLSIDAWPWLAYNRIYDEYFRDEDLMNKILNPFLAKDPEDNETYDVMPYMPLRRCWEKDYFTISRPFQQRGPELGVPFHFDVSTPGALYQFLNTYIYNTSTVNPIGAAGTTPPGLTSANGTGPSTRDWFLNYSKAMASSAAAFDVKDLRDLFQIQKWMERNARAGVRFTEFLRSHFGVTPRDERLQRPEYIGGTKSPLIVSEVLQTSETSTSPQGNLAGHGISADRTYIGDYKVVEPGIIMTLLSVMPRTVYSQGVNRQWQTDTVYDEYFAEFSNLSEQAILQREIYATGTVDDRNVFGFIPKYDEYRYIPSFYSSGMRRDFAHWHLGRKFANAPQLNAAFVRCEPRKDPFAVPSEDCLVINVGNLIKAIRPMPVLGEPGLIDHH